MIMKGDEVELKYTAYSVLIYRNGDKLERVNFAPYGRKWKVIRAEYALSPIIGEHQVLLRNVENEEVFAIAHKQDIESYIDVIRLKQSRMKWENIVNELEGAENMRNSGCSYCVEFRDYFNAGFKKNVEPSKWCPLREVCLACKETEITRTENREYWQVYVRLDRALAKARTILGAIKADIATREGKPGFADPRK